MKKDLIKKLRLYLSEKDVASFIEQAETNNKLAEIAEILASSTTSRKEHDPIAILELWKGEQGEPGIKGEPGETPIAGIDFYTEEEKEKFKLELISLVTPEKGLDYFTDEDIEEFIDIVKPIKGKDYFTKTEVKDFKKEVTPVKGEDYFDGEPGIKGKDGIEITQKDLLEKINRFEHEVELKVFKGLDVHIKSLIPKSLGTKIIRKGSGGGTGTVGASVFTSLTDAPSTYSGQSLKIVSVNAGETGLEFTTLAGGGNAQTANPLSQFAATTSAQLAGVISDETGTGALVFATSPTLVTPVLGVATGTTLNTSGLITVNTSAGQGIKVSSSMASPTGSDNLVLIEQTDISWNRPLLRINTTGTGGGATNIRLDGPAPQIEFVETDQTAPAGKYELQVNGDIFRIAGRVSADNSFEDAFKFNRLGNSNAGAFQQLGTGSSYFTGSLGIGQTTPTAILHLKAGTATASTAPLKLTSGTLNTTAEAGAVEFLTDAYYGTITTGAARKQFAFNPMTTGGDIVYAGAGGVETRLANGTASQVLQSNGTTLAPTWVTLAGGGNAQTANPLSQFAATTSAQLAGVISDETGTGALVFGTSPTLVTPALGTPASGVMTNVTGTAAGLTAGNVTTNANLTGVVTSTGNATAIANGAISNAMLANGAVANLSGTNTGDQDLSSLAPKTTPTFVTNITTPLIIGGTAVGSNIIYKSTTGAGTAAGIAHQFVGGTDGATVAMTVLNNGNVGIGTTEPNDLLQVADLISFTNADFRTQIGYQAGKYDLGQYNTWLGYQAGSADNATGKTVAADNNVGIGYRALYSNTTGANNSAQGTSALRNNTTGNYNSAQGYTALFFNTTGYNNSAQGYAALYSNTTGYNNSAQGVNAGRSITTGNSNTFAGYESGYHASQLISAVNSMALGNGTYTTASNQVIIGNASVNVGLAQTAPTARFHLPAGTATASTAPLKFTSGTLNTTAEAGAVEFLTDAYYGTITTGAERKQFAFNPMTTGGDIVYAGASGVPTRLANGTASQVLQSNGTTLAPTWVTLAGGGNAQTANPLSQFAATTSAQLAGVMSDETGSGALVFATSPTLVTPALGVATATSISEIAGDITFADNGSATQRIIKVDDQTNSFTFGHDLKVIAGKGLTINQGGILYLTGGEGGASGTGGALVIAGGAGGGTGDQTGGSVTIRGGAPSGSGTRGRVLLGSGTGLDVQIVGPDQNYKAILSAASIASSDKTFTFPNTTGTLALTSDITGTNSGTNTGDNTVSTSGAATTAVTLLNARTINGTSFNGSANITVPSDITPGTSGNVLTSDGTIWTSAAASGGGNAQTANPLSQFAATTSAQLAGVISDETGSGALVFGTSPTLVTPALGTPASGVMTNVTGTASGLTAGNVTTNANLTGGVTSVGNAATVITNANLTGVVTSTGNATAIADAALSIAKTTGLQTALDAKMTNPMTTGGDVIYGGASGTPTRLANGTASQVLQSNGTTLAPSWVTLAGGGNAQTANPLSQFAATTSAQLAGVMSDETGSGALVFATSPTLVTPALGTPTSVTLTNATGLPIAGLVNSTSAALGLGTIELGHATDTTISRVSAGVIAVEGVTIPTISSTNTLTNKRWTRRYGSTTSHATPTINTDNVDLYELTAQTEAITSFTTNLSGTPVNGDMLRIIIVGTAARAITWGAKFEASTVALPTTTSTTAPLDVGFRWNSVAEVWRCIAVA